MAEPITIYVCPECGTWGQEEGYTGGHNFARNPECCQNQRVPVRVFREEEVRPLWAARGLYGLDVWKMHTEAIDAFPAPEEWTRVADEPEEEREPTDDEIYNRHGMEGGIPYDTRGDMRDENDPSL
jgi:hypothetical protein